MTIRAPSTPNRRRRQRGTVALALALAAAAVPAGNLARAQDPPSPFELVSQLDFECRRAEGPPPAPQILIRQLNPVLVDQIPFQMAAIGELEQVCVPVVKNGQVPSPRARAIAEWADLACYKAAAPPIDVPVELDHLNPVLAGLPEERVRMKQLAQLCVPVRKNDSQIPPAVRQIVSQLDVACYDLEEPTSDASRTLVLSHLNPVIRAMNLPDRTVEMRRARQLCVPVGKNAQPIPPGVRALVQWADFLKYGVQVLDGPVPPLPLWLTHLNPLFAGVPPFPTVLMPPLQLMVPVAKDDHIPPGGGN